MARNQDRKEAIEKPIKDQDHYLTFSRAIAPLTEVKFVNGATAQLLYTETASLDRQIGRFAEKLNLFYEYPVLSKKNPLKKIADIISDNFIIAEHSHNHTASKRFIIKYMDFFKKNGFNVLSDISRTKKELFAIKSVGVADMKNKQWIG